MARHFFKCPQCGYEAPPEPYEYSGYLKPRLPEILHLLREGLNDDGVVQALEGLSYAAVPMISYIRRKYGIALPPRFSFSDRNKEMAAAHAAGMGYAAIAKQQGISPGRVQEIVSRIQKREDEKASAKRARQAAATLEAIPLDAMELPTRVRNALSYEGCKTVGDAMKLDGETLRSIPNFGLQSRLIWQRRLRELQHEVLRDRAAR